MVSYDIIFAIIFVISLGILLVTKRKKFVFQGIMALYRTKFGVNFAKKLGKNYPGFFKHFGFAGIVIGFLGMIVIFYFLIRGGLNILITPEAPPALAPVLPFIKLPGLPVLLFSYWVIGIFTIAVIHEFSHAVVAVVHKVRVKNSGFAFLGPLPAAFVELDENQLAKKSKKAQLSVLSAGPTGNIITGLIFLTILITILNPAVLALAEIKFEVTEVTKDSPAELAGLQKGNIIESINEIPANSKNFQELLENLKPNQKLEIKLEDSSKKFLTAGEHPENSSKGYMGITLTSEARPKAKAKAAQFTVLMWIQKLFLWLFILSIGIALVNLLPFAIMDGGRMFSLVLSSVIKNKNQANKIWKAVNFIGIFFILLNLSPYIIKLFKWLGF